MAKILILEDDEALASGIAGLLIGLGHDVVDVCSRSAEVVQRAQASDVDLALLDIARQAPDRATGRTEPPDGIAAGAAIGSLDIPVVYVTGHDDPRTLERAKETEPYGFLVKPVVAGSLHSTIEVALHRHRLERRLRESEARYRALFTGSLAGVAWSSRDGRILEVNPAFARILGYARPEDLAGASLGALYPSWAMLREFLETLRFRGEAPAEEVELLGADGLPVSVLRSASVVREPQSGGVTVISTIIDRRRQRELSQRLERMAYTDDLTDLPNRRLLEQQAGRILALADRHGGRAGLLYLDLSGFKRVNDALGHAAGDDVLKRAAGRIRESARDSDVVARIGGDEFAILLTEVTDADAAREAGRRIASAFQRPFSVDAGTARVGARIGVALYPDHAEDFAALLQAADQALYTLEGAHGVAVHLPRDTFGGDFGESVRSAFREGGLELAYQPIFSADRREAVGAEALLRWRHEEHGVLSATHLLPLLREGGLLPELDDWVLGEAMAWLESRGGQGPEWVSVNLSAESLAELDLPACVEAAARRSGGSPERLRLEFRDTPDRDRWIESLRAVREMGVRTVLEGPEEGTPPEALHVADLVKIDGRMLRSLGRSVHRTTLASALIASIRALGLEATAGRIDRLEQFEWIRRHGIETYQGFIWGAPGFSPDFRTVPG